MKPDFIRAGTTFYDPETTCSDEQCDRNCVYPQCCKTREHFPSNTAADAHERKLKLLGKEVQPA